jgi:hypothetical protein
MCILIIALLGLALLISGSLIADGAAQQANRIQYVNDELRLTTAPE